MSNNNRFSVNPADYQNLIQKYAGAKKQIEQTVKSKLEHYNRNPKSAEFERYFLRIDSIGEALNVIDNEEKEIPNFIFEDKKGNKKVSIQECASYFLRNYKLVTARGKKINTLYFKENHIWKEHFEVQIHQILETELGAYCNNHIVKEVIDKIKRLTQITFEKFNNEPEHIICLKNGLFDLRKEQKIKTFPDYYPTSKIPVVFNRDSKCPKIISFLEEILYPEDIPVIQEWFGFCLYKKYFIKKGIILVGGKNTGKTVLLNLLSAFIGKKNMSGINLQSISNSNTFSLSSLFRKSVNSYDDLSSDDLGNSGGFKIVTGGGYITAEYKFGDTFIFKNYSKQIFATNKIPPVKNPDDDAYYERWIPIRLDNTLNPEDQDPFLLEKLTTEEELSGLFNWALIGLKRLMKNNKFSYPKSSEQIKYIMERSSHPLASFVQDALNQEFGHTVSKEDMFRSYTQYCVDNSLPRLSKAQLGRSLEKYCNFIISKVHSGQRIWENAKINAKYCKKGLNI